MGKPKILIVDDEPDVVSMVKRTLSLEGFEVVEAFDGVSALDLAAQERPDVVLLDIMMPLMSGYEVCEQLKSNPETRDIPVLCLTSAHTPEARAHGFKAGADEVVTKPFLPAELVAQIRRRLNAPES